jgi:hypothetical protein
MILSMDLLRLSPPTSGAKYLAIGDDPTRPVGLERRRQRGGITLQSGIDLVGKCCLAPLTDEQNFFFSDSRCGPLLTGCRPAVPALLQQPFQEFHHRTLLDY